MGNHADFFSKEIKSTFTFCMKYLKNMHVPAIVDLIITNAPLFVTW